MFKKMKLISRIGEFREKAGLTQRELSIRIGVTENTIQNWEKGRSVVEQIARLIKLCEELDCSLGELIEEVPDTDSEKPVGLSMPTMRSKAKATKNQKNSKRQKENSQK